MPMAPLTWQSSSAMGASGGASTSGEGNTSSQGHPQGTEYTLQGGSCPRTFAITQHCSFCPGQKYGQSMHADEYQPR